MAKITKRRYKTLIVILLCLPALPSLAFELKSILGERSLDTKLLAGSLFYHSRDFIDKDYRNNHRWDNFRTAVGITHKGFVAYYFYTTHRQNSYSLGLERLWYQKKEDNKQSNLGYRVGILYGYCSRNISKFQVFERCDENSKYHITPMFQIMFNHTWGPIGFELATAFLMSNASLVVRFN